jgi:hypothetical protein
LLHLRPRGIGRGDPLIEILDDLVAPLCRALAHFVMVLDEIARRRAAHHVEGGGGHGPWRQPVAGLLPKLVVLGERDLLVGFELCLVGQRVLERPVLPLGIAFAFPALRPVSALVSRS